MWHDLKEWFLLFLIEVAIVVPVNALFEVL